MNTNNNSQMPSSEKDRKILKDRASLFAKKEVKRVEAVVDTYIHFRLGTSENYGISYKYVDEILYAVGLTRVPCTPPFIAGIVNRRGKMLTVIDLKRFFQTTGKEYGNDSRVIVITGAGITVGVLADEMFGNKDYYPSQLTPPLPSDGVSNLKYVTGIDRGMVTILNINEILGDPILKVNETAR
ncbi:MAG TPA: chemotaxis protein CheW [Candidatus Brocadiaceae bacterium]|nr:chemotaxis protein CheW [Candidatus Brocadiaceae bacterium]